MNLIIDIGNTLTKTACFNKNQLFNEVVYSYENSLVDYEYAILEYLENNKSHFNYALICDVAKKDHFIHQWMINNHKHAFILDQTIKIPIENRYKSPETLGYDRLALAVGANHLYPEHNNLIISCGTCITYEFINAQKQYIGGAISPGLHMRFKALHHYTAKLPLISEISPSPELIGTNTNASIKSGVINGMCFEIEGVINKYSHLYPALKVILTGGDIKYFADEFKSSTFAIPNLSLIGLNIILEFNKP